MQTAAWWHLMVIEGIYQRDEAPGLSLLVQGEAGNVPDEDGVKQPGHLQVVAGPQRLQHRSNTDGASTATAADGRIQTSRLLCRTAPGRCSPPRSRTLCPGAPSCCARPEPAAELLRTEDIDPKVSNRSVSLQRRRCESTLTVVLFKSHFLKHLVQRCLGSGLTGSANNQRAKYEGVQEDSAVV